MTVLETSQSCLSVTQHLQSKNSIFAIIAKCILVCRRLAVKVITQDWGANICYNPSTVLLIFALLSQVVR